jgi:hypothetical protein
MYLMRIVSECSTYLEVIIVNVWQFLEEERQFDTCYKIHSECKDHLRGRVDTC